MAVRFLRDRFGFPPRPRPSTASFRIDSMEPARVCAGAEITLRGVDFTDTPGLVRFAGGRSRRRMPIDIEATSWTDTEIVVTIPVEAACGPIELRILEERVTVSACDAFLDFSTYRTAEREFLFGGCRPRIAFLGLAAGARCATVGSSTAIAWSVEPDFAETSLTIREGSDPDMPVETDGGTHGSVRIDTSRVATYTFVLTAADPESECDEVTESLTITVAPPPPSLSILGVEITQGIQRFSPKVGSMRACSSPPCGAKSPAIRSSSRRPPMSAKWSLSCAMIPAPRFSSALAKRVSRKVVTRVRARSLLGGCACPCPCICRRWSCC